MLILAHRYPHFQFSKTFGWETTFIVRSTTFDHKPKFDHKTKDPWASYQIRKIAGCAYAGNAGNVSPPPPISNPDMHPSTYVTHVPWCMPGSRTSGLIWIRCGEDLSSISGCMRNSQFHLSGKRPMRMGSYSNNLLYTPGHPPYNTVDTPTKKRQKK